MTIRINLDECIGCGVCVERCPEVFKLDEDEGKGMVISQEITDCAREAADSCPVSAITID